MYTTFYILAGGGTVAFISPSILVRWESWEIQLRLHWQISSSHATQYFLLMYLCWRRIQMGILLFKETVLSWMLAQQAPERIDVLCQPSGDYVRKEV